MALSSSLYTGTSGLVNMGNNMQIISNNIANSSTVGYKKGTSAFADTLSQTIATQSGTGQVGRGMSIGEVARVFDQGSLETTSNTTDLAIGGDGFFIVSDTDSGNTYYTRAGNFQFDESGQFINSQGYIVQGWALDAETGENVGAIGDIVMQTFTSPPAASTEMTVVTNLDSTSESNAEVLANFWDGAETTNIDSSKYEYQTVVTVYDSLGSTHDVTVYYDKKSETEWEYIIATNPEEDQRELVQGTSAEGLLAKGTITFSPSSGDIIDITMYELDGRIGNLDTNGGENDTEDVHFEIINSDTMAQDGYDFELEYDSTNPNGWTITYSGQPLDASTGLPYYDVATMTVLAGSDDQNINVDFDGDGEVDLKIQLDKPAATGNQITFDLNDEEDIHVQGLEGDTYTGDTADGNTTIQINNPNIMTLDSTGIVIEWDNATSTWGWSGGTAPAEYASATISGDKDKAVIDLDGSGGDDDSDDIVFTFEDSLAQDSSITFNIVGTNAWREVTTTELEETGYFSFTTDFLGGEFGTTETDIKLDMGSQYVNASFVNDALSTTQFAKSSTTVYQDADGYSSGSLESVDISTDGTITGVYSNGETIPLFRVGLAKFLNNNGLYNVGGNLFRQTSESGEAITNIAGENGLGTISPNSLEMSNVDISEEFVEMITTQRGFQANSKTITTVDDMLNTVISMKR